MFLFPQLFPMRHRRYLRLAETYAYKSNYERWPVGAVLVRGGSVLTGASNDLRNPADITGVPFEQCSLHAEMAVLKKTKNVVGSTIYVARVLRTGSVGLAKPCSRCQKELMVSGVRQAVWTIDTHSYGITNIKDFGNEYN